MVKYSEHLSFYLSKSLVVLWKRRWVEESELPFKNEICIKLCWNCFPGISARRISAELVVKEIMLENVLIFALKPLTGTKPQIIKCRVWIYLQNSTIHQLSACKSVSCLSVPVNLRDEIWPRPARAVCQDGNCPAGRLAAPEYHQAVQIKMSWDNVTAGRDEHGKEKYGDGRCRSDSVCWHSFLFRARTCERACHQQKDPLTFYCGETFSLQIIPQVVCFQM